jgi:predicted ester cyclase
MSTDYNLELIHRMYDALNAQDLDAHDKYWTEDMIWHGPPAFGDVHGIENDIEVADGNWVAATGFLTATHQGEWLGIPPTGKPVKMRFSDFWLIKDGLLSENWVMTDDYGVLVQLGLDPLAWLKSQLT